MWFFLEKEWCGFWNWWVTHCGEKITQTTPISYHWAMGLNRWIIQRHEWDCQIESRSLECPSSGRFYAIRGSQIKTKILLHKYRQEETEISPLKGSWYTKTNDVLNFNELKLKSKNIIKLFYKFIEKIFIFPRFKMWYSIFSDVEIFINNNKNNNFLLL